MPVYQIEMLWECSVCHHLDNPGLGRNCQNCGKEKTDKCREYMPDDISVRAAITDSKKLAQSLAGPDWKCRFCNDGSLQNRLDNACQNCGVDQATGQSTWTTDIQVKTYDPVIKTSTVESIPKQTTNSIIDSVVSPAHTEDPEDYFANFQVNHRRKIRRIQFTIFGLLGIAVIAILFIVLRTRELNAGVRSVAWTQTISIDKWQKQPHEGFHPPGSAVESQGQGSRIEGYNHTLVGSHQEGYDNPIACGRDCTTPSCYTTPTRCSSNKNGGASCSGGDTVCPSPRCSTRYCAHTSYRTVNDYKEIPYYGDYYTWKEWEWIHNRDVTHSGTTVATTWPEDSEIHLNQWILPGEHERQDRIPGKYHIVIGHHGELWTLDLKSEDEFRTFPVGSRLEVNVNMLGHVEIIRHGR